MGYVFSFFSLKIFTVRIAKLGTDVASCDFVTEESHARQRTMLLLPKETKDVAELTHVAVLPSFGNLDRVSSRYESSGLYYRVMFVLRDRYFVLLIG